MDNSKIAVLRFKAEWCGPCKMMGPVFKSVQEKEEYKDVTFQEIDVDADDQSRALAQMLNIRNLPTVVIAIDGMVADRKVGYMDENALCEFINKYVNK